MLATMLICSIPAMAFALAVCALSLLARLFPQPFERLEQFMFPFDVTDE